MTEYPWPDPKVLERMIAEKKQKPARMILTQPTLKELLFGPASEMWKPFVAGSEEGTKIIGVPLLIKEKAKPRTITMLWPEVQDQQIVRYTWPGVMLDDLGRIAKDLVKELRECQVREENLIVNAADSMGGQNIEMLEKIKEWLQIRVAKALATQRLTVVARIKLPEEKVE